MKTPLLILLAYASCFPYLSAENNVVCSGDTYVKLKADGQAVCKKCRPCSGGGIGWNESYERQATENGYLDCYPCALCPAGTYRKLLSSESRCLRCVLDCKRANRYESQSCGFDNEGHCADCFDGFIAESSEANSRCVKIRDSSTSSSKTSVTPNYFVEATLQERLNLDSNMSPDPSTTNDHPEFSVKLLFGIVAAAIFAILLVAIILGVYSRKKSTALPNKTLASDVKSSQKLISSTGTNLGEDYDIETDGGHVRGEIPQPVTLQQFDAIKDDKSEHDNYDAYKHINYDRVLDKNDETFIVLSATVFGERRYELFLSYLNLDKAIIEPEEEKWQKYDKITYKDYIHNVFKRWVEISGEKATLKWLCEALHKAAFYDAKKKVLDLPENKFSVEASKTPSEQVCIEMPDDSH